MANRFVSVGDDFTLPADVKAADANLPARLQDTALNATYAGLPKPGKNKLTGMYHAEGYGAVGDNATDSRAFIDAAILACSSAGGGTVYLPPGGQFVVSGPLTPRSNVTIHGQGAEIRSSTIGNVFYARDTVCKNFAIDGLTFTGPVTIFPDVPTRVTANGEDNIFAVPGATSGPGTVSAFGASGDTDPDSPGGARVENITIKNCRFLNLAGLPYLLKGVRGVLRVINNEFTRTMDPGTVGYEELIFTGNHVLGSRDNGVSASRGGTKITITGNTFENCAFNGIFVAGFLTHKGPENFTITGNVVKNVGNAGIYLDSAPKHGTVTGNELDGGYFRGPVDIPTNGAVVGIFIGGYPGDNRAAPTDWAESILVAGNQIRRFPRAGIFVTGAKHCMFVANQLADNGTQYMADGTTAISVADQTQNVGILFDNATTGAQNLVAMNHITDSRPTPYMNWAIVPVGSSSVDESFNTMYGARNAYNLVETGQTRNVNNGYVFQQNTKHTAGATAGSTGGTGTIAGYDINGAAGSSRRHKIQSGGSDRWQYGGSGDAESGSNVGTDLVEVSYSDAGTLLATVRRQTRLGAVTYGVQGQPFTIPGRIVSGAASVTGITAGAQAASATAGGNGANDTAGTINATAVASPAAGTLATLTFATSYTATPHVVVSPQNAASAQCQPYVTRSATGFTIACATAPGASAALSFDYHVMG
jgi:hypothetical protein